MGKGNWFLSIIEKNKGVLVMIFVQLVYSGMALFSKAAISKGMNPYVFVAYRQAFATLALAPFAFFLDRKKSDLLSYSLIGKIFLASLFGITLSLNLYAYAINYVSATFASASNNTIPALTFLIAVAFRIESFSIRNSPGIVKLVGSVVSLSGAMVFAFVKGPRVNFMNWHTGTDENQLKTNPVINFSSKEKWIQGCLLMLSANTAWASWLVIQAPLVKQYRAKFRLTMLQCLFSCIQSSVWAMSMNRDLSSWKLNWDLNLFSVAYCEEVSSSYLEFGLQDFHCFNLWVCMLLCFLFHLTADILFQVLQTRLYEYRLTMTLNLQYITLSYVSATFATAITNTIPALVFIIAVLLRIEEVAQSERHGWAKVFGTAMGLSGAMVYTSLHSSHYNEVTLAASFSKTHTREEWIKGSLIMIASNLTWALWLIMQLSFY